MFKFLEKELREEYRIINTSSRKVVHLTIRTSIVTENHKPIDYIDEIEPIYNVYGYESLLENCKSAYASLFTNKIMLLLKERKMNPLKLSSTFLIESPLIPDYRSVWFLLAYRYN